MLQTPVNNQCQHGDGRDQTSTPPPTNRLFGKPAGPDSDWHRASSPKKPSAEGHKTVSSH